LSEFFIDSLMGQASKPWCSIWSVSVSECWLSTVTGRWACRWAERLNCAQLIIPSSRNIRHERHETYIPWQAREGWSHRSETGRVVASDD